MIRVLLIGPLPPPVGGDTRHFETLAQDLAVNPEFTVTVFDTSRGPEHYSHLLHNLWMVCRMLTNLLRNLWRVDIVSFHSSDRGMFLMAPMLMMLARLARKPVVLRLFGGSFGDFYAAQGAFGRALSRRFILGADVVLLQTKRLLGQLAGQGRARLEWFSTYIRPATRPPEVPATPAVRCSRFVFLGHMWRDKGIDTILQAAGNLPETIEVDLYGPLDEYTAAQLEQRGCGRVHYRGQLSRAEVDARLWDYHCLLLPTFHPGEGYPGVIAEAFAHELPVISTRWLAIPEIVDDSCGLLIEPRDSSALVAAMRALHEDGERWQRMKLGAARRAADFDHAIWAHKFERICAELVKT